MDRTVLRHVAAAVVSLGLAALVVAAGASLPLPPFAYPALVVSGALVSVGGVYAAGIEWNVLFGVWPPWALALVLSPSTELALGLLAGAVGGVLAVPVVLKVGGLTERLAG